MGDRPDHPLLLPDEIERFRGIGVERRFSPGDRLVSLGSESSEVFYLLDGLVKIAVVSTTGNESVFGLRTGGDFIGEMSMLNDERRSADCIAVEPTRAIMVTAARFTDFIERNPAVALALLRMLSRRLNDMTVRAMLGTHSVKARVAQRLLDLTEGSTGATVELTQGDLAKYVDASREWTSKALGELRRHGAIRTERGRVVIVDPDVLLDASLGD